MVLKCTQHDGSDYCEGTIEANAKVYLDVDGAWKGDEVIIENVEETETNDRHFGTVITEMVVSCDSCGHEYNYSIAR